MNRIAQVSLSAFLAVCVVTGHAAQDKPLPLKPDLDPGSPALPYRTGDRLVVARDATLFYALDEGFEGSFPPAGWTVINPDAARTWSRTTAASGYGVGGASARMNFYDYLPNEGQVDSLLSPVITGLTAADSLSFDYGYCAFPNTMVGPDTVELYLSTDGGTTFGTLVTVLSYADSTAPTTVNGWVPSATEWGTRRYTLPGSAVGAPVQLLFVAHNHYAQNFYLDNVRLGTRSVNDIAVAELNAPADGGFVVETRSFTPAATFTNVGTADQLTPFVVRYLILDTAGVQLYTSSRFVSPLNAGAGITVTFDPQTSGLAAGPYVIRAITELPADEQRANDTLTGAISAEVLVASFPYSQDFEAPTEEGWSSRHVTGSKNDWVRGTPNKPVQLTRAHSGLNAWVTLLDTTYSNSQNAALYSPFFDMTGATTKTVLEFYQNFRMESGWDAGVLEYSTNLGSNWYKMDTTLGQGPDFHTVKSRRWYNSSSLVGNITPPKWSDSSTAYATHDSGWIRSTTSLGRLAGQANVRFRWRFRTDGSDVEEGWAIDDVGVYEDSLRSVTVRVQRGWDMVSNPITTQMDSVVQLFPNSVFPYVVTLGPGGVELSYRVEQGVGYWGKFANDTTFLLEGRPVDADTVPVVTGWNMIGSVSLPVAISSITSIPPGLQASLWYGFDQGYVEVTTLVPGESYWIKASAPGAFVFPGFWPAVRQAGVER